MSICKRVNSLKVLVASYQPFAAAKKKPRGRRTVFK